MELRGARHEGAEPRLVDDEVVRLHIEPRPQLEAVAAAPERLVHGLGALGRGKVGEPGRPGLVGGLVDQIADEDIDGAGGAHRFADFVDVGHDVARDRQLDGGADFHETVLQIDDDMGGALGVEILEHVQRTTIFIVNTLEDFG